MIKILYRNLKDKELKIYERQFKVGSWIYAENPTTDEIDILAKDHKLDKGLLTDALDPYEVPRMEREDEITYIYTRVPDKDDEGIITVPLLIAIGDKFTLTLSRKKLAFLEPFTDGTVEFYTTQKTKFLIHIFSAINGLYSSLLTKINRQVRTTKAHLSKIKSHDIVEFVNQEEILNDFLSALIPTNAALQKMLAGAYLRLYEEDKDLVEDLMLGTGELIELCKHNMKNIVNIRDSYSTIMTHNLNRTIKLLTALTIILTVPTIIASLYGMNVRLPYQDVSWAFAGIVTVTVTIIIVLLALFKKNDWL